MWRTWISIFLFQSFFVYFFPLHRFHLNWISTWCSPILSPNMKERCMRHKKKNKVHIKLCMLHIKWKFRIWICQIKRVECMCSLKKLLQNMSTKNENLSHSLVQPNIHYKLFLHTAPVGWWIEIFIVWYPENLKFDIHSIYFDL